MEKAAYYDIATYLKEVDRAISPHELSVVLGKSRVTIQSSLKRLLKNGWVAKEGSSPKVFYRAVDLIVSNQNIAKREVSLSALLPREQAGETLVGENTPNTDLLETFVQKSNQIRYSKSIKSQ